MSTRTIRSIGLLIVVVAAASCTLPSPGPAPVTGPSAPPPAPLQSLSVSSVALRPQFRASEHDYAVPCQAGSNIFTVTATPSDGYQATFRTDANGRVILQENEVLPIDVRNQTGSSEMYWIRCLPHDFPELAVTDNGTAAPGWYILALGLADQLNRDYVVVLDEHGSVLWYHHTATGVLDAKRMPDGNIAWMNQAGAAFGTDPNAAYEVHSLDGALVRNWATVGTPTDGHDMQPLPNGNVLLGSYHQRSNVDVSGLGLAVASPAAVLDAWIQEVRPDGTVAWEWHSEDHLAVAETTAGSETPIVFPVNGVSTVDLIHPNSYELDPVSGDIIFSGRHTDAVMKVRRNPGQADDGKVLWKLGGNAPTDPLTKHLTFVGDPYGGPARQHDARVLSNGHVTLYDNRTAKVGTPARGVEYAIDEGAGTATMVWQQTAESGQPACCMGSLRRQPDGSNVIGWGSSPPLLTDYGPSGQKNLEVSEVNPPFNYRAIKEPVSSFDRATLRANAGH